MTTVAIVTFDGFNEIDSFVALHVLGRASARGVTPRIAAPSPRVTSTNGVAVERQMPLEDVRSADVVLFGSGTRSAELAKDAALLGSLGLDPTRQLVGSQCSGALFLHALGLLRDRPLCTDRKTRARLLEAGAQVLEQPFVAYGNVATAGGCMSSLYLAAWVLARSFGEAAARDALVYAAPVSEEAAFVDRAIDAVRAYI